MQSKTSIQALNHCLKSDYSFSGLSPDAKQLLNKIKEEENDIESPKIICINSDGKLFNFNTFKPLLKFASNIYNGKITLGEAKKDQHEMFKQLKDLEGTIQKV